MIRRANKTDITVINKLGSKLHDNFERVFAMEREIVNKDAIVLVNETNGIVNAYLYARDAIDNIDLLSIYVDEDYRHQHIATMLINELINNYCYQKESIILEVSVLNEPAVNLYKKIGFKIVNIRKNYYNGHDAYLMKLEV